MHNEAQLLHSLLLPPNPPRDTIPADAPQEAIERSVEIAGHFYATKRNPHAIDFLADDNLVTFGSFLSLIGRVGGP
jgi:hypothetical protein